MGYLHRVVADSRGPTVTARPMVAPPVFQGEPRAESLGVEPEGESSGTLTTKPTGTFESDPAGHGEAASATQGHPAPQARQPQVMAAAEAFAERQSETPRAAPLRPFAAPPASPPRPAPLNALPAGNAEHESPVAAPAMDRRSSQAATKSPSHPMPSKPAPPLSDGGGDLGIGQATDPVVTRPRDRTVPHQPAITAKDPQHLLPRIIQTADGPAALSGDAPPNPDTPQLGTTIRGPAPVTAPPAAVIPRIGGREMGSERMAVERPVIEPSRPSGTPEVRIGKLDVFVQAPAGEGRGTRPATPRDSSSRCRLRSL